MRVIGIAVLMLAGSPTAATVVQSGAHGFELSYSHVVPGPPAEVMQAFGNVDVWWDSDHTYSGSSDNLTLSLKAGGCFCEALPGGGGVEHMRVTYVDPGKRIVMTGSLGPLLYEATTAVLDVRFAPSGKGTKVTATYKAAGFANGGAAKMAPLVDQVMARQFGFFAVYATPPALAN